MTVQGSNSLLSKLILYLVALVAGAIYPLGFAPLDWWALPIISIACLWSLLQQKAAKQAFRLGFCFGFGLFAVGTSWVYVSINVFGNAAPWLAGLLTVLCIAFLALFFALLCWIYCKYFSKLNFSSRLFAFAILWVLFEIARGSGIWSFPWMYLGYSQTSAPFMGLASLVGVYGLSLFLVMLSVLCAELFIRKDKLFPFAIWPLALLTIGIGLSGWGLQGKINKQGSMTLALIQPNVDQHIKWNRAHFSEIINGLFAQTTNYWGADLIVWPEAAIPAYDTQVSSLLESIDRKAKEEGSQFITGVPLYQAADGDTSEQYFAGIKMLGQQQASYKKQQLVPFGEYVPFQSLLRGLIDFFDLPMSSFSPGSDTQEPFETSKSYLVPAICYEIAFSGLIHQLAAKVEMQQKSKVILTISNDTWFGKSWGPLQHFQMAQMRALENGLPVIRATNNGLTALINHYGQVEEQAPRFEKHVLAGVITLDNRQTIFARYGYLSLWLLMSVMGLLVIASIFKMKSKR